MDSLFPPIANDAELEALRERPEPWLPALRVLSARHGLEGEFRLFEQGSCVLFGVGERWVVKLFEPDFIEHFHTERRVMEHVQRSLPVPTPELHAAESLEGWGCLVMTRLPGRALSEVWDSIDAEDRASIAEQLGTVAAAIHLLPTAGLESLRPAWPDFVEEQRAGCLARHRAQGQLSEAGLASVEALVASVEISTAPAVLLHTELTSHNLLADRSASGRWELSGLVDFEPSMLGVAEYDLVAPAVFVCRGERDLLRRTLLASGRRESELDAALQRRLMLHTLLHRYSHLGFFWRQLSESPLPDDLAVLTDSFFPM